jgi:hypothetical protein
VNFGSCSAAAIILFVFLYNVNDLAALFRFSVAILTLFW